MTSNLTPQQRAERSRKAKATRAATIAATRRTTRPGSEQTTLRPGDAVRIDRAEGPTDVWKRFAGRYGTVAVVNTQRFENGTTYTELGIQFAPVNRDKSDWIERLRTEAWFRCDEVMPA